MVVLEIIKITIDMTKLLFSAALLFLSKLAAFAVVDLGTTATRTPYDRYMTPVKQTFASLNGEGATMQQVQGLMRVGRGFRYSHTDPYNPALPQQTAATRKGDCKDKALWLIDQLNDPTARFVVGKEKRGAAVSHAWVMWQHEGQWWILDCTLNSRPFPVEQAGLNKYVPLYSWTKGASFRHGTTGGSVANVAGKSKAPVASKADRRIAAN
jgi:hypothetical protein